MQLPSSFVLYEKQIVDQASHPLLLLPLGLPPAHANQHGRHGDRHEEEDGDDGDGHGHEVLEAQSQDLRLGVGPGDDV